MITSRGIQERKAKPDSKRLNRSRSPDTAGNLKVSRNSKLDDKLIKIILPLSQFT